mgnify:CR=1 FL=1
MDFKTIVNGPGGLAAVAADTLLVVLVGNTVPASLDKAVNDEDGRRFIDFLQQRFGGDWWADDAAAP